MKPEEAHLKGSAPAIAARPGAGMSATAFTAAAALACAGAIHWSAARDHTGGTALAAAVSALAALQILAAVVLMLRTRETTALAAVAALAGLGGWVWSATPAAGLDGHSAWELPALVTVALEIVALAAALALRLGSRGRAWIDRHSALLWGAAVPVAGVALLVTLLALAQGTAAHGVPVLSEPTPTHGH